MSQNRLSQIASTDTSTRLSETPTAPTEVDSLPLGSALTLNLIADLARQVEETSTQPEVQELGIQINKNVQELLKRYNRMIGGR